MKTVELQFEAKGNPVIGGPMVEQMSQQLVEYLDKQLAGKPVKPTKIKVINNTWYRPIDFILTLKVSKRKEE